MDVRSNSLPYRSCTYVPSYMHSRSLVSCSLVSSRFISFYISEQWCPGGVALLAARGAGAQRDLTRTITQHN
jgi:hypothetical protein